MVHTFARGTDRYGYYAYEKNGQLVIGEDWPHEGGDVYVGSYADAGYWLKVLQREEPDLYNSIVKYYTQKENNDEDAN